MSHRWHDGPRHAITGAGLLAIFLGHQKGAPMRPSNPQLHRCNATRRQILTEEARKLAAICIDRR